jgi:hypothetical protein
VKGAEWKRLVRPLIPEGETWVLNNSKDMYRVPFNRVVFGVVGESSSFDQGTYVWRWTQPLFIPIDFVVLSYSTRIGGGANKISVENTQELQDTVREAMVPSGTEEQVLARFAEMADISERNLLKLEVSAYSELILGDVDAARAKLEPVAVAVATSSWSHEFIDRANLMLGLLADSGRDAAVAQLDRWVDETVTNLKLRRS